MNNVIQAWIAAAPTDRSDFRFQGSRLYYTNKLVAVRLMVDDKPVILAILEAIAAISRSCGSVPIFTATPDGLGKVETYMEFLDAARSEGVKRVEGSTYATAALAAMGVIRASRCPLPKRLHELSNLDRDTQTSVIGSLVAYRDVIGLEGFNWAVSLPEDEEHSFGGSCVQAGFVNVQGRDKRQPVYLVNFENDAVEIKLKDGFVYAFVK